MYTDDKQLIYLATSENLYSAKKILIDRYLKNLVSASIYYIKKTFPYLNFDYEEIKSFCYDSIIKTMNVFDISQTKFTYAQALFQINRSRLSHLCLKNINESKTIDNGCSIEAMIEKFGGELSFLADNSFNIEEDFKNDSYKEMLSKIMNKEATCLNEKMLKDIIMLRAQGFKNREIAIKLNIPTIKVSKIFNYFIINAKRLLSKNEPLTKV